MPTTHNDTEPTASAVVTIRIPDGSDGDLVTAAAERLAGAADVESVTVTGFRGLEPRLSATLVTVEVEVETALGDDDLGARLRDVPGVSSVSINKPPGA